MAMQHLEREFRKTGDPRDLERADILASMLKARGKDIPFPSVATPEAPITSKVETVKMHSEISLEEEWQRQAQELIKLGFNSELGLTERQYLESLPKFTPQPESFKGRLDTSVIVETRISPKRQAELAGIQYFLDGLNKIDWNKNLKNYTTPEAPYAAWLEDGRNNLKKKPEDVRSSLKADEIGGTEFDGIALYISNPKILEHHFLDLPGTSVGSGSVAYLDLWGGRPRLSYFLVDGADDPRFGSVVRGRQK